MSTRFSIHPARGSALVLGFTMIVLLAVLVLAFSSRMTSNEVRLASDVAGVRAYELAQTWNTLKIQSVWRAFKSQPMNQRVAWLGGEDANGNGRLDDGEDANGNGRLDPAHAPDFQDSAWQNKAPGEACTRIKVLYIYKREWTLVRFTTWARVSDDMRSRAVIRKIQRVVRFELGPASAFDYAYFANNHAAISGQKLSIYGSVGANGDVDLSGNPLIDGSIFASSNPDIGATGIVNGSATSDPLGTYVAKGNSDPLMRPTQPAAPPEDVNKNGKLDPGEDVNHNGKLDDFAYIMGYDGTQSVKTLQKGEVMPDFGNLDYYRNLAGAYVRPSRPDLGEAGGTQGGIVKQLSQPGLDPTNPANYNVLIDQTYGFNGESGYESVVTNGVVTRKDFTQKIEPDPALAWRNGNVALIGTDAQPLVVLGPVVISNDLVIKGPMTGQGTFYTGRNTHVVGDLSYKNGPQWKQNDINFADTAAANKKKDIVGFGVAGNVVFGDYTNASTGADQWNSVLAMLKPPFVKAQSPGLNILGLVLGLLDTLTGYDLFTGDYTKLDGGRKYNNNGTMPLFPDRTYYESSFPDAYIHSIATNPSTVQGIFYTYHFFGGRLANLRLYGSMIARDEAIVTDNNGTIYYDPRISKQEPQTYVNLFLPRTAALNVIATKEPVADDAGPSSPDW